MSSSPPLIISRRAFQRLSKQYPKHFESSTTKLKGANATTKKTETPWPRSLQIAGYSAIALSIPYTFGTIISESPNLRGWLEENDQLNTDGQLTWGQLVVSWVRWGWGEKELEGIPYTEDSPQEKSLKSDVPVRTRSEQVAIEQSILSDVKLRMKTKSRFGEENNISAEEEREGSVSGKMLLSNSDEIYTSLTGNAKSPNERIIVNFEDDADESQFQGATLMSVGEFPQQYGDVKSYTPYDLMKRRASRWPLWSVNPIVTPSSDGTTSTKNTVRTKYDPTKMRIDELEYNISDLRKALQDPLSTRSFDDMEDELQRCREELRTLKRRRRLQKLGSLIGRK